MLISEIKLTVNKKILFVAIDAGSALFLSPVINQMSSLNNIDVICGKNSFNTFSYRGIKAKLYDEKIDYKEYVKILLIQKYDIIFLGTNLGYSLEKEIIKQSKKISCTIAVVDHFWHTWHRFSNLKKPIKIENSFLPDLIWVFNDFQCTQLENEGIRKNQIMISEHPYLKELSLNKDKLINFNLHAELNISKKIKIIVYASEPQPTGKVNFTSEELHVSTIEDNGKMLVSAFKEALIINSELLLIIKKHPTENIEFLEAIFNTKHKNIKIINNIDPLKLIFGADLILGMTSMFLLEAEALKKKVASLDCTNSFYGNAMKNRRINVINNKKKLKKLILSI